MAVCFGLSEATVQEGDDISETDLILSGFSADPVDGSDGIFAEATRAEIGEDRLGLCDGQTVTGH